MKTSFVIAISENGVIGKDGKLPWYIPEDLKHFKEITMGHHTLMGRKTYESIIKRLNKPLPGRVSIVLTRNPNYEVPEGVHVVDSLEKGIELARDSGEDELMIIGGKEVFKRALPLVDKIYLTRVLQEVEGNVTFEIEGNWREIEKEFHPETTIPVEYQTLERKG